METYLENIDEIVQDRRELVTYKFLSLKFRLNVNVAKQLLFAYSEHCRKRNTPVSCIYLLAGFRKCGKGKFFELVPDKFLKERQDCLQKITSLHIYSVQQNTPKDYLTSVYSVDYLLQRETLDILSSISGISNQRITPKGEFALAGYAEYQPKGGDEEDPLFTKVNTSSSQISNEVKLVKENPNVFFSKAKQQPISKLSKRKGSSSGSFKSKSISKGSIDKAFALQSNRKEQANNNFVDADDEDDFVQAKPPHQSVLSRPRIIESDDDEDGCEEDNSIYSGVDSNQKQNTQNAPSVQNANGSKVKDSVKNTSKFKKKHSTTLQPDEEDDTDTEDESLHSNNTEGEKICPRRHSEAVVCQQENKKACVSFEASSQSKKPNRNTSRISKKKTNEIKTDQALSNVVSPRPSTNVVKPSTSEAKLSTDMQMQNDIPKTKTMQIKKRHTYTNEKGFLVTKDIICEEEVSLTEEEIQQEREKIAKQQARKLNPIRTGIEKEKKSANEAALPIKKRAKQASLISFFKKS